MRAITAAAVQDDETNLPRRSRTAIDARLNSFRSAGGTQAFQVKNGKFSFMAGSAMHSEDDPEARNWPSTSVVT